MTDAISILIQNVTLSGNCTSGEDESFYVHYRFLSFGDVVTNLENVDAESIVAFQHRLTFPILSAENGSLEPVLSAISKDVIRLTLFSNRKRNGGNWELRSYGFHVAGEGQVPLRDIWGHADLSIEIVSSEGEVMGTVSMAFDTTVQPICNRTMQDMRQSAHNHFMALLTGVISTLGDKVTGTINTTRLLRFMDPQAGILEMAKLLQKQMITHFPGKTTSEIFAHPPDEEKVSQTQLG